jgi:hypothetical protein
MATAKQYRIQDFEAIIFNGLEYTLPAEVLHNIMDLQQKLGYQKVDRPQHNKKMPPSSSWKPPPPKEEFKATIIVQERIGIEKDISNLRVSLNKISGKNFDSQCEIIIKIIEPYLNDEESLARIVQTIFDISGSNSFLSELNAKLYLKLTEKSVYFLERIQDLIQCYKTESYSYSKTLDTEAQNKENDKRKAMTNFMVNLMKQNVVSSKDGFDLMNGLLTKIENTISIVNKINEVEEMVENLFLFLSMGNELFKSMEEWDSIYDRISVLAEMKVKEKPSLSNRILFKFRDLLDLL